MSEYAIYVISGMTLFGLFLVKYDFGKIDFRFTDGVPNSYFKRVLLGTLLLSLITILFIITVMFTTVFLGMDRQIASSHLTSTDFRDPEKYIVAAVFFIYGAAAYMLRCSARWFYGLLEIAVGIAVCFQALAPNINNWSGIQLLGGLYIIVRGLDNIEKGIRAHEKLHNKWKLFFGSQV